MVLGAAPEQNVPIVMFHVPQLTWNQTIWQPNKWENITKKQFHFLFILFKASQTFAKREIVWLIIVQQRSFLQNYALSIFPVFYENQWTASKYLLHAAAKVPAESESNVCLPQLQSVTMKIIWDFRRRQIKTFSIIIWGKQNL